MMEIWKDINGYEGLYQISNLGRVKSTNYNKTGTDKILKNGVTSNDYHNIVLSQNGKTHTHLIHRLVAEAFIPNPDNKPCINHINTVRGDNRVENLEWCTHKENSNHPPTIKKIILSNGKRGKEYSKNTLQLNKQGAIIKIWNNASEASKELKIDAKGIYNCCNNIPKYKSAGGYRWVFQDDYLADWWEQEMEKGVA